MVLKSRILQFINKELMTELNSIAHDVLIPDNNTKVNLITACLDKHDVPFAELGSGTNRHSILIDGYVFKIGMDKAGIVDNWAEFSLAQELYPFVTKCYECNGLIAVSEYVTVISKDEFNNNKEEVRQILSHLAEGYLLGDVGAVTKNFMNWGYRSDGSLVILDYAYIYRVIGDELICGGINKDDTFCDSPLDYDENFNKLRCPRCGKTYTFHEIRRKIGKDYEEKELNAIKHIAYKLSKPSQDINVKVDKTVNLKNNIEGESNMSKYNYDEPKYTDEEFVEFDEQSYEDAIEFMKGATKRIEKINASSVYGEMVEPLIKDIYMVDEAASKLDVTDQIDPLPEDDDDDDDENDLSIEDVMAIVDRESAIEEENDELEEETGIPDDELNDHEPEYEEDEPNDQEIFNDIQYDRIVKNDDWGKVQVNMNLLEEDSDDNNETPVDETETACIIVDEPTVEEDVFIEDPETPEYHDDEPVEEVDVVITTEEDVVEVVVETPKENPTTVKIEVNDDTMILTSPENVDKMRALLMADIESADNYDDSLDEVYEKNVRESKMKKSNKKRDE